VEKASSVMRWTPRRRSLVSTRCTCRSSKNRGAMRLITRSMSAIIVPRPGPISTSLTPVGVPCCCQACTMKTPTISPNSWLISGAVMKSPWRPKGSRVR
jgi:hypothetical protein